MVLAGVDEHVTGGASLPDTWLAQHRRTPECESDDTAAEGLVREGGAAADVLGELHHGQGREQYGRVACLDRRESSEFPRVFIIFERLRIHTEQIQTQLPASEEAFQLSMFEPTATLNDALSPGGPPVSSFAHRVVAAHVFHECFDTNHDTAGGSDPIADQVFWARYRELDDGISSAFAKLPDEMQCPSINTYDPDAVLVNLQLHTARICLYRAAAGREKRQQQGSSSPPVHTISRCLPSAHQVVTIAALVFDIHARFQNPFIAFAVFMSALALLKHYEVEADPESYAKLMGLVDIMVAVAGEIESAMTASLAVQLARELARTGVDPYAMHKVAALVERMDLNGPLVGREEGGKVLLCPLEARFGPSPANSAAVHGGGGGGGGSVA